ncbi:hypothetical protein GCM10027215_36030 [Nocardioides zeae]
MTIMATWKEDIATALAALGGEASLSEIYAELPRLCPDLRNEWQATVRGDLGAQLVRLEQPSQR